MPGAESVGLWACGHGGLAEVYFFCFFLVPCHPPPRALFDLDWFTESPFTSLLLNLSK